MEMFLSFIFFVKVFVFVFSILYALKVGYEVTKVYVLKEGKVELGRHGLLWLGLSVSYIMSFLIC